MLRIVSPEDPGRGDAERALLERMSLTPQAVERDVRAIIDEVRAHGDAAVRAYTERFEKRTLPHLELSRADGNVLIANSAGVLVFSGTYGGDVRVINNTDVRIGDIDVSGALDCQGNTPPPDLIGVIHAGTFRGQCAPSE